MTDTPKRTKSETARIVDAERAFRTLGISDRENVLASCQEENGDELILTAERYESDARAVRQIQREFQNLDAEGRARLLRVLAS